MAAVFFKFNPKFEGGHILPPYGWNRVKMPRLRIFLNYCIHFIFQYVFRSDIFWPWHFNLIQNSTHGWIRLIWIMITFDIIFSVLDQIFFGLNILIWFTTAHMGGLDFMITFDITLSILDQIFFGLNILIWFTTAHMGGLD